MSFDECPPYPVSYDHMKKSVERTLRWAKRGKKVFNNPNQIPINNFIKKLIYGKINEVIRLGNYDIKTLFKYT